MLRNKIISWLGGYTDLDDAIDTIKYFDKPEKVEILDMAVKKLFNTIGKDDILHQKENGDWIFRGRKLDKATADAVTAQAQTFVNSLLWNVLKADIKWKANELMYFKSKTEVDIITGKLLLWIKDIINTRLNSLNKGTGIFNKK